MPARTTYLGRSRRGRRRTVRIVERRRISRAGAISLIVAASAALVVIAVWRFWQAGEVTHAYIRTIEEQVLDWRCERGHTFRDPGREEPRSCPTCGKPAYPVRELLCPTHGTFTVYYRYTKNAQGRIVPSEARVGDGEWVFIKDGIHCPKCGKELVKTLEDPLDPPQRHRRRPGG